RLGLPDDADRAAAQRSRPMARIGSAVARVGRSGPGGRRLRPRVPERIDQPADPLGPRPEPAESGPRERGPPALAANRGRELARTLPDAHPASAVASGA